MTNYDKVIQMQKHELVELLANISENGNCTKCPAFEYCRYESYDISCYTGFSHWLSEEIE